MSYFTERREKYHTGALLYDVTRYIDDYSNVTLAELARDWPEHFNDGSLTATLPGNPKVVIWIGLSPEGAELISQMIREDRVHPCEWMAYMIDGMMLDLPIVEKNRVYKKPRWLPIKFMRKPVKPLVIKRRPIANATVKP